MFNSANTRTEYFSELPTYAVNLSSTSNQNWMLIINHNLTHLGVIFKLTDFLFYIICKLVEWRLSVCLLKML